MGGQKLEVAAVSAAAQRSGRWLLEKEQPQTKIFTLTAELFIALVGPTRRRLLVTSSKAAALSVRSESLSVAGSRPRSRKSLFLTA